MLEKALTSKCNYVCHKHANFTPATGVLRTRMFVAFASIHKRFLTICTIGTPVGLSFFSIVRRILFSDLFQSCILLKSRFRLLSPCSTAEVELELEIGSRGVTVSTLDSESKNPSSNLGGACCSSCISVLPVFPLWPIASSSRENTYQLTDVDEENWP